MRILRKALLDISYVTREAFSCNAEQKVQLSLTSKDLCFSLAGKLLKVAAPVGMDSCPSSVSLCAFCLDRSVLQTQRNKDEGDSHLLK